MFEFTKNCQMVDQSGYSIFTLPPAKGENANCSTCLLTLGIVSLSNVSHCLKEKQKPGFKNANQPKHVST